MRRVNAWLWPPVVHVARSPAAWCFAIVWVAALAVLTARGFGGRALGAPLVLAPVLGLCWLTVVLTVDPPAATPEPRPRVAVQAAVVLTVVALIGLSAMSVFGVGPRWLGSIPIWSGLFNGLLGLGDKLPFGARAAVVDPVLELLLPLALLLLLGARLRELGFGGGYRTGVVLLLWSVPQLVNLLVLSISGGARPLSLLVVFIRNGFQNGPVEEFLFRGALQTRLSALFGPGWGLVLAALAFGAWHIGANARFETHGDLVAAVCAGVAGQTPYGLALGVIYQRTRNLVAGSLFHMVLDLP